MDVLNVSLKDIESIKDLTSHLYTSLPTKGFIGFDAYNKDHFLAICYIEALLTYLTKNKSLSKEIKLNLSTILSVK